MIRLDASASEEYKLHILTHGGLAENNNHKIKEDQKNEGLSGFGRFFVFGSLD